MEQEIIEGNKLIAEFMDAEFDMNHYHVTDSYTKEDGTNVFKYQQGTAYYEHGKEPAKINGGYPMTEIHYHTSWDWLMPVVKKVSDIINPVNWDRIVEALADVDINKCFDEIVKAIKWYNQNKK